jgi:hypothetical protein
MITDLWPKIDAFEDILEEVEAMMANDSDDLEGQATGSDHRMEAIAARARRAEEREARRQAKLAAEEESLLEESTGDDGEPLSEVVVQESSSEGFDEHAWLVE